jgi:hypothetical protein
MNDCLDASDMFSKSQKFLVIVTIVTVIVVVVIVIASGH